MHCDSIECILTSRYLPSAHVGCTGISTSGSLAKQFSCNKLHRKVLSSYVSLILCKMKDNSFGSCQILNENNDPKCCFFKKYNYVTCKRCER